MILQLAIFYYIGLMAVSFFGTFGGNRLLTQPWDVLAIVIVALIAYYWALFSCLPKAVLDKASEETEKIPR